MTAPLFFVIARVVGRDNALTLWKERLVALCEVSKTEPYSNSYYWGSDIDGEPDTLWGLEGYSHPIGFFMGHVSTDIFKEEMRKVDEDKLLRNVQGLASPDYDLHHYDFSAGFLKRSDDGEGDAEDSLVTVLHFWAKDGQRKELLTMLADCAEKIERSEKDHSVAVQSFAVLKELNNFNMASLYVRSRTLELRKELGSAKIYQTLLKEVKDVTTKLEVHHSKNFIGHIDQPAPHSHQ